MKIIGFWRRVWIHFLTNIFIIFTAGFYLIFLIIAFVKGKPNLAMRLSNTTYSNPKRMFRLFIFLLLSVLIHATVIGLIIDIIRIIMKKGTFAEKWSNNYYIKSN
ncbi:hypothetical protein [Mycoplasma yeatsii]|uniref:Membrane protein n=1 Tax=Mycoplasma yeatsii TaxID=51365 RepID=A0ABU0ND96_9MOLU|nr:hypothetical protein [Mycoplasma yeatsii]AJM71943.1 membrane protein [Mycoplasma yeatsii GM274B]MDQ0567390.1 putative membrane protein [Mycoplasma yeatsii]